MADSSNDWSVPKTADDLLSHIVLLRKHINLKLLLPHLIRQGALTADEKYNLQNENNHPMMRIDMLIDILTTKGNDGLEFLLNALKDSSNESGSAGHSYILKEVFKHQIATVKFAEKLCMDNDALIGLLAKLDSLISQKLDNQAAKTALDHTVFYLSQLRLKESENFLLDKKTSDQLQDDKDLTFLKLFSYLTKADNPIIIPSDVSMLHKINAFLRKERGFNVVSSPLCDLVTEYEKDNAIENTGPPEAFIKTNASLLTAKVSNAQYGGPQLKSSVNHAFLAALNEITFNYRGKDTGSVVMYWEFSKKYFDQVHQSLEHACQNRIQLGQILVIKVEAEQKSSSIHLEMQIVDPKLCQLTQQKQFSELIAPAQEDYVHLLLNFLELDSKPIEQYFKESSNRYPFKPLLLPEGKSLREGINALISENKLHCYDVSVIQHLLYKVYSWSTVHCNKKYDTMVKHLLLEIEKYNPGLIPSWDINFVQDQNSALIKTLFTGIASLSFEILMTLKYVLSQFFNIAVYEFYYVKSNSDIEQSTTEIIWETSFENFKMLAENLQQFQSSNILLLFKKSHSKQREIQFSFQLQDSQILLDGSPNLILDLESKV